MTKSSIEVTKDWADSRKYAKSKRQKITVYSYKNNVASEGKTLYV